MGARVTTPQREVHDIFATGCHGGVMTSSPFGTFQEGAPTGLAGSSGGALLCSGLRGNKTDRGRASIDERLLAGPSS